MKNRKKALIIAIICLAAAAVLYLLAVKLNQKEENEDSSDDSLVISSVDSDKITAISYEKDGKSLSFIKEDGTWYDAEDKSFPVDQDSLTTMTNALGAVSATRKLEDPEDLSEYGLDSPVLTVRYTSSDNKEAEFSVGDTNDAASGAYLKISGDDAVYLVASDFADSFNSDIYQLADMESFPTITSDSITDINVESDSHTLEIKNDNDGGRTILENGEEQENCAESAVTQFINTVTGITFKSHVAYNCKDLSKYGLDKPIADISVDYTTTETVSSGDSDSSESESGTDSAESAAAENSTETASTEKAAETVSETVAESAQETADAEETEFETETETVEVAKQLVLHIGSQNEDGDYYAALDGSKEVHVISEDTVKELTEKKASDFVDNTILSGTLNNAKSIDVTIGTDSWHLVKEEVVKADDTDTADSAETESSASENASETTDAAAVSDETTADAETADESETETEAETEEKWFVGDTEISLTELASVYKDLSGMSAEKILDAAAEPGGDAAISVTIKWEDDTETTVSFTAYDSSFHLAEINGEARKLVNKRDVEKLVEDMTALLNK